MTQTEIQTRYQERTGERIPCVNVKVHQGLESITPEQWEDLRSDTSAMPDGSIFGRTFCESYDDSEGYAWSQACQQGFESAEQDAKALFGDRAECSLEGRSGGWLVVRGLPDVEEWGDIKATDLVNLSGSVVESAPGLPDDADMLARWRFFEKACAAYVADVPYMYADFLAHNVWERKREQAEAKAKDRKEREARINTVRWAIPYTTKNLSARKALDEIAKDYLR